MPGIFIFLLSGCPNTSGKEDGQRWTGLEGKTPDEPEATTPDDEQGGGRDDESEDTDMPGPPTPPNPTPG